MHPSLPLIFIEILTVTMGMHEVDTWQGSSSLVKHFQFQRQYLNNGSELQCPGIKISRMKRGAIKRRALAAVYPGTLASVLGFIARSCHIIAKVS